MKASQAILKAILSSGAMSRTQLSKKLGISASSVSDAVSELIDKGILIEVGYGGGSARGRKNILLDVDTSFGFALGIGIWDSTLCAGLATVKGQTLAKRILNLDENADFKEIQTKAHSAVIDIMTDCCLNQSKIIGAGICLSRVHAELLGVDEDFLKDLNLMTIIEPADEYIEYAGAYMPINPEELYIFGCAKVVRDLFRL